MGDHTTAESPPTVGKKTRASQLETAASEEMLGEDVDEEGNAIDVERGRAYGPGGLPDAGARSAAPAVTGSWPALKGMFGVYEIATQFVEVGEKRTWALRCTIEMTPSRKATGKRISWVQVVRRHDHDTGNWATKRSKQNGMNATREQRTDPSFGSTVAVRNATHFTA